MNRRIDKKCQIYFYIIVPSNTDRRKRNGEKWYLNRIIFQVFLKP